MTEEQLAILEERSYKSADETGTYLRQCIKEIRKLHKIVDRLHNIIVNPPVHEYELGGDFGYYR